MNNLSTEVSPGLGAFVAFFALALVLWLLMRSMNGKLRGIAYRGEREGAPRRRTQHQVAPDPAPPSGETPPRQSQPGESQPGEMPPGQMPPGESQPGESQPGEGPPADPQAARP